MNKVAIFLDFWNYELTIKEKDTNFKTDWFKIHTSIMDAVSKIKGIPELEYHAIYIFGSYDSCQKKDLSLCNWANNTLKKIPGSVVHFDPRQKKTKGPCCTGAEHHEIIKCPHCNCSMVGTQEKGIDTKIVTEMLDIAYRNICDIFVLISADKDFIPVVEKIQNQGKKVINAYFPNHGNQLSKSSWSAFNLYDIRESFRR